MVNEEYRKERDVRQYTFDTTGMSGFKYNVGDVLAVYPHN